MSAGSNSRGFTNRLSPQYRASSRDLLEEKLVGWLCWGLTSQSTIFQSCGDGAIASWVINQYFRGVKCLAQGHNTAAVGLEPRTSRSGVRHSTTEPPLLEEKSKSMLFSMGRGLWLKWLVHKELYFMTSRTWWIALGFYTLMCPATYKTEGELWLPLSDSQNGAP